MKLFNIFAAVIASAPLMLAAPAADVEAREPGELAKRGFSVYVCEGANWTGTCRSIVPPWNGCQPFSSTGLSGYQSWGPGEGTVCLWYTGASCTGTQSDYVQYPGWSTVPTFWQFNTASFKCWT